MSKTVMVIAPAYRALYDWLTGIDEQFIQQGEVLRKKRHTVVKIDLPISSQFTKSSVIIKSFQYLNWFRRCIYAIRPSKAKRSYIYSQRLLSMGILVPQPIAYIEKWNWYGLGHSYYVAENWHHDTHARAALTTYQGHRLEHFIAELAAYTRTLHAKGVFHRDYNGGNILVRHREGKYQFALVDLNRIRYHRVSKRLAMKSLQQVIRCKHLFERLAAAYGKQ